MGEQERADKLAKAIDDLLQGIEPELDDAELRELLQIAKIRRDAAHRAAQAGAQHEREVWELILSKLDQMTGRKPDDPNGTSNPLSNAGDPAASQDPGEIDFSELGDIIALRRELSDHAIAIAENHRDAVWQQVQARLRARPTRERRGLLGRIRFWRKQERPADQLAEAVDRLILGEPVWEAEDSKLAELVQLARARRALGNALAQSSRSVQGRVWARLRPRLMAHTSAKPLATTHLWPAWPKLAALAAALVIVAFALGPLPATGLAHHPAARVLSFVGHHLGVTETDQPPAVPPPTGMAEGREVALTEVQDLLGGLTVREPSFLPDGFQKVASRYYPTGITDVDGGMLLLAYQQPSSAPNPPTILIYQERATDNTVAVQTGFPQAVTVAEGVEGTYYEGSWHPRGSEAAWVPEGAQTVIFDRGDVRNIIIHRDADRLDPDQLLLIAASMLGATH